MFPALPEIKNVICNFKNNTDSISSLKVLLHVILEFEKGLCLTDSVNPPRAEDVCTHSNTYRPILYKNCTRYTHYSISV